MDKTAQVGAQNSAKPEPAGKDFSAGFFMIIFWILHFWLIMLLFFAICLGQ